jgi:hypothetical protein
MPAIAKFIEPMLLLRTEKLPEGDPWAYELLCGGPHITFDQTR